MLNVRTFGSPDHPAVIGLHGFMGSHRDFLPLCTPLSERFYWICPDLPGMGESPLEEAPTLPFLLDQIEKLRLRFSLDRFHLVGYSMGGRIAAYYYGSYPDRLRSLSLISTRLEKAGPERAFETQKWIETLNTNSLSHFIDRWYRQPLFCRAPKNLEKKRLSNDPQVLKKYLHLLCPSRLPSAIAPLQQLRNGLFCYGQEDLVYASMARSLAVSLPHMLCRPIEEGSHALLEEAPEKLATIFMKFWETL